MLLFDDGTSIWINELESWPEGFYKGGDEGVVVEVTGVLIGKYDLPVYIQKDGEPAGAGIPVPEGTDLKMASFRLLIDKAKWSKLFGN